MTIKERRTPIKKISTKKKADLARQRKVRAKLLLEAPIDSRGFPLCPQCGKLPDLKDGRGELHLCHGKSLAQGGRTSYKNCYLACRKCHNGPDGHRVENMPKTKVSDQEESRLAALTGKYGNRVWAITVEQQVGKVQR